MLLQIDVVTAGFLRKDSTKNIAISGPNAAPKKINPFVRLLGNYVCFIWPPDEKSPLRTPADPPRNGPPLKRFGRAFFEFGEPF